MLLISLLPYLIVTNLQERYQEELSGECSEPGFLLTKAFSVQLLCVSCALNPFTHGLQRLMGCILQGCVAGSNIVGSCCIHLHTTANTNATTPNFVGAYSSLAPKSDLSQLGSAHEWSGV